MSCFSCFPSHKVDKKSKASTSVLLNSSRVAIHTTNANQSRRTSLRIVSPEERQRATAEQQQQKANNNPDDNEQGGSSSREDIDGKQKLRQLQNFVIQKRKQSVMKEFDCMSIIYEGGSRETFGSGMSSQTNSVKSQDVPRNPKLAELTIESKANSIRNSIVYYQPNPIDEATRHSNLIDEVSDLIFQDMVTLGVGADTTSNSPDSVVLDDDTTNNNNTNFYEEGYQKVEEKRDSAFVT